MKRPILIVANWKMNPPTLREATTLCKSTLKQVTARDVNTILAVPTIFLEPLVRTFKKVNFSAQNCASFKDGPHTGEVSAKMLTSIGVRYVIVGHSERRALRETNDDIAQKVLQATKSNLTPIVCIGEKERDRTGFYLHEVKTQIETCLSLIPKNKIQDVVMAYEPVWAISDNHGRETTPEEFTEMMLFIRKIVADLSGIKDPMSIPVLYGGSANEKNVQSYLDAGAQGFLVGHASLDPKKFGKMIEIAKEFSKRK